MRLYHCSVTAISTVLATFGANAMKRTTGESVFSVIVGLVLTMAIGCGQAFADNVITAIKLFEDNRTFATGETRAPFQAEEFASTSETIDFDPRRQMAVISSTKDGGGGIIIDNFLTIDVEGGSSINICLAAIKQEFPASCFGQIVNPFLPEDARIETVFAADSGN